ncbi:MAG TPA: hypothetical protein VFR81_04605 [Longimicrobium sp.]|nr:hypothetical protein [Longimicrobium sp.]
MNVCIVVEEQSDVDLLKRIIPPERRQEVGFVRASRPTQYSAISAAQSVRSDHEVPIILLLDARTVDEESILYHWPDTESLLMYGGPPLRAELLFAVPELEVVLFHAPAELERLLGVRMTDEDRIEARFIPKKVLARLLERSGRFLDTAALVAAIDEEAAKRLACHPLIRQVVALLADLREHPVPKELRYLLTG